MNEPNSPFIHVGEISKVIAEEAGISKGKIYVSIKQLQHIAGKHETEINQIGMKVLDYIRFVCQNFNQIRKAANSSVLLVVYSEKLSNTAAIDLNFALDMKKGFWEIKTAEARRFSSIKNKTLIWEAAKHTSNGRRYRPN